MASSLESVQFGNSRYHSRLKSFFCGTSKMELPSLKITWPNGIGKEI
jgi:hypothetical protein